jgi:hypothetical protein
VFAESSSGKFLVVFLNRLSDVVVMQPHAEQPYRGVALIGWLGGLIDIHCYKNKLNQRCLAIQMQRRVVQLDRFLLDNKVAFIGLRLLCARATVQNTLPCQPFLAQALRWPMVIRL